MNALLLTEPQASALLAANGASTRKLIARRLADDRLIINADALADDLFGNASNPWRAILLAATPIILTEEDLAEPQP